MECIVDVAEFDRWLSGIAVLTPPQRRQAWQSLALSEASDCDGIETVLCSNRHRSFDSARENKAIRPQDHLKRDATANLLIFYGNSGVWWRLLHNSGTLRAPPPWNWS